MRSTNSLAFRVLGTTLLFSTLLVSVLGSILNQLLSDGIRESKIEAVLNESQSKLFQTENRFVLSEISSVADFRDAMDRTITEFADTKGNERNPEVIILQAKSPATRFLIYERSTNQVMKESIPIELRDRVRASKELQYSYGEILYPTSFLTAVPIERRDPALIVGGQFTLANFGQFEMYFLFSTAPEDQTLSLISRTLLIGAIALVLVLLFVVWVVSRQVVTPVRRAAEIAEKLSAGDFAERMNVEGADEIARLAQSFNEMASALQNQITRLENLSRVQQRFVSDVSHELRTPLTTLKMASDLIYRQRQDFDPTISRSAELLSAQLERFENLLTELLEVSRFDAGVINLEPDVTDIVALVEKGVDTLTPIAKEHGSIFRCKYPTEPVVTVVDPRRMDRILRNLLNNAIAYGEGKPIDVAVRAGEHSIAVAVRDYGIGLREGEENRVFDRFWRADPSRERTRGGTGLGLSIAQEDAQLHGGIIEAAGVYGRGSLFVLTIPRDRSEELTERLFSLLL
ncbi:MAG: MtrAB system histidine kinase MtrB [Actinomycetota bacterium]